MAKNKSTARKAILKVSPFFSPKRMMNGSPNELNSIWTEKKVTDILRVLSETSPISCAVKLQMIVHTRPMSMRMSAPRYFERTCPFSVTGVDVTNAW